MQLCWYNLAIVSSRISNEQGKVIKEIIKNIKDNNK